MKRAQIELNHELFTREQLEKCMRGELVEIKIVGRLNTVTVNPDIGPIFWELAVRGYDTEIDMYATESSILIVEDE